MTNEETVAIETAARRRGRRSEDGQLMAGLMAAVAIMMIFSLVTFQTWEDVVRRDNEAEMMFRAQEIARAIQKYRRDHGGLTPEKLEELMEPGPRGQYYLRRLYKDPLVKDGKWGLLYLGPGGQIIDPAAPTQPETAGGLGAPIGSTIQAPPAEGAEGAAQNEPTAPGNIGNPVPQEIGGMRIAGVRSLSTEDPFRVHKGFRSYNEWLFTFLDLEQAQTTAGATPGQPVQPTQPRFTAQPPGSVRPNPRGGFTARPPNRPR